MLIFLQKIFCNCFAKCITHIGGQAVIHGLIMRNNNIYALAVRDKHNRILVEKKYWYTLRSSSLLQQSILQGFPLLLETIINGLTALNRSENITNNQNIAVRTKQNILETLLILFSILFLFLILPHIICIILNLFGISGNIFSFSFHFLDGILKLFLFIGILCAVNKITDIKEILQYHGAEHKVIHCFESGMKVSAQNAKHCTRLHPRCGTNFAIAIFLIAILFHSILIPFFLFFPLLKNTVILHLAVLLIKIVLIIPISAIAFKIIILSAKYQHKVFIKILTIPILCLQFLTTKEPTMEQLEVAVIALKVAINENDTQNFETAPYTLLYE